MPFKCKFAATFPRNFLQSLLAPLLVQLLIHHHQCLPCKYCPLNLLLLLYWQYCQHQIILHCHPHPATFSKANCWGGRHSCELQEKNSLHMSAALNMAMKMYYDELQKPERERRLSEEEILRIVKTFFGWIGTWILTSQIQRTQDHCLIRHLSHSVLHLRITSKLIRLLVWCLYPPPKPSGSIVSAIVDTSSPMPTL